MIGLSLALKEKKKIGMEGLDRIAQRSSLDKKRARKHIEKKKRKREDKECMENKVLCESCRGDTGKKGRKGLQEE